jgi:hypothetical protein
MTAHQSYTVDEFAKAERMSRSMVYKLWGQGKGPCFYMIGNVRRITHQARIDWQQARQAEVNHAIITDFNRGGGQ